MHKTTQLRGFKFVSELYRPWAAAVCWRIVNFCGYMDVAWSAQRVSAAGNLGFVDRSNLHLFIIEILGNPELYYN
jgi:hypothetical protein